MEVTKTMVLDIAELSQFLESGIGEYLRPEEAGWWLPYNLEPILKEGRPYYVQDKSRGLVKLDPTQRPAGLDVYDRHADILVTAEQTRLLKDAPHPHPARCVKLIKASANLLIDMHAAWGEQYEKDLQDVIRDFVYPQYEESEDILSMIADHLLDFRTTIRDFLGKDKWIMHFLKVNRGSLTIEKTVDYRIYSWMVEHGYWGRNH